MLLNAVDHLGVQTFEVLLQPVWQRLETYGTAAALSTVRGAIRTLEGWRQERSNIR